MASKNPKFSWSGVREDMFHSCELCYLMHYYTAHKGWLKDAPPETRAAYRWKRANTIDSLLYRTLIEALIERVYNGEPKLSVVRHNVLSVLNDAFTQSINNKEEWYDSPKKNMMLYELVYQDKLDDELVKGATQRLDTCLHHFKGSQLAKEMATGTSTLKPVKESFRGGYAYCDIDELGVRAYSDVQVVHERADGMIVGTLFRTTNEPSSLTQIRAVAETIAQKLDVSLDSILVRDEFLLSGTYTDHVMTKDFITLTSNALAESVDMMSVFLIDKDTSRNEFSGFKDVDYTRAESHRDTSCKMESCPYCEAVRRDLELYPLGYDSKLEVLKYRENRI